MRCKRLPASASEPHSTFEHDIARISNELYIPPPSLVKENPEHAGKTSSGSFRSFEHTQKSDWDRLCPGRLRQAVQTFYCQRDEHPLRRERCEIAWAKASPWGHSLQLDQDRKSTRLNSSHLGISYAVFCL